MEIREIRIGNRIEYLTVQNPDRWEEIVVSPVTFGRLSMEPLRFRPIELTPEWLERFGFEYAEGFADDYTKQPITVYSNPFKVGWIVENLFNQQIKEDILVLRYIHQLQNLFYALTGEELAIDKTSLKN